MAVKEQIGIYQQGEKTTVVIYHMKESTKQNKMGNRWKELIVGLCSDITGKPLADFKKAAKEGGK